MIKQTLPLVNIDKITNVVFDAKVFLLYNDDNSYKILIISSNDDIILQTVWHSNELLRDINSILLEYTGFFSLLCYRVKF